MGLIQELNRLLSRHDKIILGFLLGASIVISCIETLSITAIMLFISVATNFELVYKNKWYAAGYKMLGCSSPAQFIMIFGAGLFVFYVIRAVLNIIHLYSIGNFSQQRYREFSSKLFHRFLQFPYKDFVSRNSAVISQSIFNYSGSITYVIQGLLLLCAELLTVLTVYAMLFFVNWKMTCVLSVVLSIKMFFIFKIFSKKIAAAGKRSHQSTLELSKIFNESFWNFKLIKLTGNDRAMLNRFGGSASQIARANTMNALLQGLPRFILETIGFLTLIFMILYIIYRYGSASSIIPTVSLYALAFYRLLPSINKILTSYNQIMFSKHALAGIENYLTFECEKLGTKNIIFNKTIVFNTIGFYYTQDKPVLRDISFTVNQGERIAFVGESGAGKSTLVDILMGLYKPTSGSVIVDDVVLDEQNLVSWRTKFGYIPQSIYLFDGTIAENIVFGRQYDKHRVIDALKKARMYDFVFSYNGLETKVGEAGITLSGGQKQRIAIARALYDNPVILVLDEATSALDNNTEHEIIEEIYNLGRNETIFMIAHRLSTIERCDRIFKIEDGCLYEQVASMPVSTFMYDGATESQDI